MPENRLVPPTNRTIRSATSRRGDFNRGLGSYESRIVAIRHHASVWIVPAVLLVLALLPWPYGYYTFLRLSVCPVSGWLAYEQWRHDNAVSGWVVGLGATSLLFNPLLPIHLTREIWNVLDLAAAVLLLAHLRALRRLITESSPEGFTALRRSVRTPASRLERGSRKSLSTHTPSSVDRRSAP